MLEVNTIKGLAGKEKRKWPAPVDGEGRCVRREHQQHDEQGRGMQDAASREEKLLAFHIIRDGHDF